MKKLITIFGAILFASVMMTSCGSKEADDMVGMSGQGEDTTKTNTDMSGQGEDTTKTNTNTTINTSPGNDDGEDNSVNSEKEISQLEKDAIIYANGMCEMKEIEDKLDNPGSEEEFNKATADLGEFQEKYKNTESYMENRYPDETSEEFLEIKNLVKTLLLKCFSQEEIDGMMGEQ